MVINKEKTFQTLKLDLSPTDERYNFRLFLMNSFVKSDLTSGQDMHDDLCADIQ